jgi:hypothetical protein
MILYVEIHYLTDMTEKQWQNHQKMVPPQKKDHNKRIGGHAMTIPLRMRLSLKWQPGA